VSTLYRDTGVVLRVQKLGEADRIVTLLTRRCGKIRAVAKGVRRTRSRWGARLEPFNHVDVQCYTGRSLDVITQCQTLDAFGSGVVSDYARYTAGCAILETADRLVSEEGHGDSLRVYLLLVGAVRALAGRERDASLILDAFLLRAMSHAGWAPSITECAKCAAPGPHRAFSVQGGGAVCDVCRPPGSVLPGPDAADAPTRRDTSGLVAAHLQWHMERQLRSLPLVERVSRP
jgi:DNA repair protein RecO (recombination protein O)